MIWLLDVGNTTVLAYFVLLNVIYLITTLVAYGALRRYARRLKTVHVDELLVSGAVPPITLIVPAYNEAETCVEAVRSLLTLRYPEYEIIVVNDGSQDATLQRLTDAFVLEPSARAPTSELVHEPLRGIWHSRRNESLWVLDKENGGKSDALNAGLAHCRTPLFCAMDADSLLERDALTRVVRPFLEDTRTIAVGGIIRIVNGCTVQRGGVTDVRMPKNFLARLQVLEYLRAFLAGRMGWAALRATLIVSGAFGLFRRGTVVAAGGFATDTVGEDMELIVRLHRYCSDHNVPYRITFVPDPVAWTQCPETVRVLGRQRDRWQRGLTESLLRHRVMMFRRRYGIIGLVAFPYFFCLEMVGPAIEVLGYLTFFTALALGKVSTAYAITFFMVGIVFGAAVSIASVGLEEMTFRRYPRVRDLVELMVLSFVEVVGYRQLNQFWRARGLYRALRRKGGWGVMTRREFAPMGVVR